MTNNKFLNVVLKKGKPRNIFIFACVMVLTFVSLQVSYSSLLSVKQDVSNNTTSGSLIVSFVNDSSSVVKEQLVRMTDEEGMNQSECSAVYIQNTNNLNTSFVIDVGYDIAKYTSRSNFSENDILIPVDDIRLAVFEYIGGEEILIAGPLSMSDLTIATHDDNYLNNRYLLLIKDIGGLTSGFAGRTYKIKTWLSEKTPTSFNNAYYYINYNITDIKTSLKKAYNIFGTIEIDGVAIANAKINFHNGSQVVASNNKGDWELNNVYAGTYNLEIEYENEKYVGNITIEEGDKIPIIASLGTKTDNSNIWDAVYKYGTSLSRILVKNNINNYNSSERRKYELYPTYKLFTGTSETINTVKISLDKNRLTFDMSIY